MKKFAVIVAAGSGSRMGGSLPKQFMLVNGKPVLYYTIKTFLNSFDDLVIILVLPADYTEMGQEIIDAYFDKERVRITAGGDTRFQSVKNGLQQIGDDAIVFVHDGVRCLLTLELIHRCYHKAIETGTAIPVVPGKDSVRFLQDDSSVAIERNNVKFVQTPQTFHSKILLPAYQIDYKEKFTDEATVVEAFGMNVTLVEGDVDNIKITKPIDLVIAEKILKERESGKTIAS